MKSKDGCPFNNFRPCKKFDCTLYVQIRGTNPNTGQEVDEYGCSIAWMPILLLEGAQQQRQTGAAVESFRNVMVKSAQEAIELASERKSLTESSIQPKLIEE